MPMRSSTRQRAQRSGDLLGHLALRRPEDPPTRADLTNAPAHSAGEKSLIYWRDLPDEVPPRGYVRDRCRPQRVDDKIRVLLVRGPGDFVKIPFWPNPNHGPP